MVTSRQRISRILIAVALLGGSVVDASAATARHYFNKGHGYAYRGGYHHRHYGAGPAVGAAVAGTALGIIGLAAGAAAANRYDNGYDGYEGPGYAPGYYGQGYAPGYYGQGYAPY